MRAENAETVNCPSCGSALIGGLRFCRMCGYRLGEGVDEYVPTQRLDPATAAPPRPSTDPFAARQTWGAGPMQPVRPFGAVGDQRGATSSLLSKACSTNRGCLWWLWMVVALMLVLGVGGAVVKSVRRAAGGGAGDGGRPAVNAPLVEADGFDTADGGGAMIRGLSGPGTSLEAAGLVGGDVITNFDGQPVRDRDAIKKLIAATPIGKAVKVVFIHDGETKETSLTMTGGERFRGMDVLRERPGGRGVLSVEFDDGDRVRVPNTTIYGVELDDVKQNGPAYIAGLKEGDIIIAFDGKPIRTAGDLRYRAGAAVPLSTVDVVVVRDGRQMTIPVKMGGQK
ncbi:MAG TPA: PDZ domain-containing protein [Pyrinomonadaceae bacterium]|nr:PDZ domain-containing protein [Pyrinomonadaceae bacterium]